MGWFFDSKSSTSATQQSGDRSGAVNSGGLLQGDTGGNVTLKGVIINTLDEGITKNALEANRAVSEAALAAGLSYSDRSADLAEIISRNSASSSAAVAGLAENIAASLDASKKDAGSETTQLLIYSAAGVAIVFLLFRRRKK